jgi:hypothetical protein
LVSTGLQAVPLLQDAAALLRYPMISDFEVRSEVKANSFISFDVHVLGQSSA